MRTRLRHRCTEGTLLFQLPVLSSFQAFWVQLSYCRLKQGHTSTFLTPDRPAVGKTRKNQPLLAFLSARRYNSTQDIT